MSISQKIVCNLLVLFIALTICQDVVQSQENTNDELVFAHTICRHGDRNIYPSYPNDPWKSEEHWPEGFSELTNIGKQQSYTLGQYLRKRYAKLLGNGDYSPDKVYVYSTDIDRNLMTAQVTLAGLFPPQGYQIWNENFIWQPVPVHTTPRTQDALISPKKPCDRYKRAVIEYRNSTEFRALFESKQTLIKYLEENSGLPLNSLTSIHHLYDKLYIERLKGKRLPSWTESVMTPGGDFEYLVKSFFLLFTPTAEMKKLRSGFLLREILDRSKNKTESTLKPNRSLWMYFVHDTTIADMLNSLGLFKVHLPEYASCLFFELYKADAGNYLQIFYKNSTEAVNFPALAIPNCGSKCPLNKWYELYRDILPIADYDTECDLRDRKPISDHEKSEWNPDNIA